MGVITQQMKSVALSGNANKSDANNFNEGLFKYLLFVAKNARKTSGLRPTKT
jgi:hypothetical protein